MPMVRVLLVMLRVMPMLRVLQVMLWLMVLLVMPTVRPLQVMLRFTVSLAMMIVRVLQVVVVGIGGTRVGGLWPVFGRGPCLFLAGGLVGGVAGLWARES